MKKLLTILLFLFTTTTVLAQQYTYGGKKYDYKVAFPMLEYRVHVMNSQAKDVSKKSPFTIYLSRKGYGIAIWEQHKETFTFTSDQNGMIEDDLGFGDDIAVIGNRFWIHSGGIGFYFDYKTNGKAYRIISILSSSHETQKATLSDIYSLVKDRIFMSDAAQSHSTASMEPNVPGEKQTGKDGFVWYKQSSGGKYGALDELGNVIVPTQYDEVEYKYDDLHHFTHYFKVKNGDHMGAYTRKGYCVVKPEQGWDNVECHSNLHGKVSWSLFKCSWNEATLHMDIFSAMTDAHAKKYVIKPTKGMFIHMDKVYVKNYNYFGENETADEVVFYCRTDSDGRSTEEFAGLIDMDGNYIIYPDEYKSIRVYIDKLELNGVKSNIKIPTGQSSFDYNNFDDLFYK